MLTVVVFFLAIVRFSMTFGLPGDGGVPGGIGMCENVDSTHRNIALNAVDQMSESYTLRQVLGVRTQSVAGTLYYFELQVSSATGSPYETCKMCDVQVMEELSGYVSLQRYTCKTACCF